MTTARRNNAAKERDRQLWASGSYARIAELVAPMAHDLVALAQIAPATRVLDVATGTGNAALAAARTGAEVTAADLTPELLTVAAARAASLGLTVDWVEADAEDLPFPDGSFDVVLSCIGAMFAPDQRRTAAELVRVCRPGGRIAMANWTPDGYGGAFFAVLAEHAPTPAEPAPPGPPTAWGDPDRVRTLFGDRVAGLRCRVRSVVLDFTGSPEELFEVYRAHFGPVLAVRAALRDQPAGLAAFDQALLEFLRAENDGPADGPGRYEFDYLAVTAARTE